MNPNIEGLLSGSLFWLLRRFVLHTNHSLSRSVYAISGALFLAGFADSHFITLQVEETRTVGNIPLAVRRNIIYVWPPGKAGPFVFILSFICMATNQVLN